MAQINKPSEHINSILYTGNGSTQSVTGVGFQPDLCIFKNRDQVLNPTVLDSARGLKYLYTTESGAEGNYSSNFTSFDSDGFSLGSATNVNGNGDDMLCYNWKANGTGSSNTDGSITSTVSANTTAGFSIVSYTGTFASATVGHGLGVAPKVIIVKNRDTTNHWCVGHNSLTWSYFLNLNLTDAQSNDSTNRFIGTAPTSSVFTVGQAGETNGNNNNMIAYCFAEKKGYSKFGSYIGNGSVDGTFVYLGFKPAWVLWKKSSGIENWGIANNKSSPFNIVDKKVRVDTALIEATGDIMDFTSNGFKIRTSSGEYNGSGGTYVYMAFAEQPLVGTNNIPATAR